MLRCKITNFTVYKPNCCSRKRYSYENYYISPQLVNTLRLGKALLVIKHIVHDITDNDRGQQRQKTIQHRSYHCAGKPESVALQVRKHKLILFHSECPPNVHYNGVFLILKELHLSSSIINEINTFASHFLIKY